MDSVRDRSIKLCADHTETKFVRVHFGVSLLMWLQHRVPIACLRSSSLKPEGFRLENMRESARRETLTMQLFGKSAGYAQYVSGRRPRVNVKKSRKMVVGKTLIKRLWSMRNGETIENCGRSPLLVSPLNRKRRQLLC